MNGANRLLLNSFFYLIVFFFLSTVFFNCTEKEPEMGNFKFKVTGVLLDSCEGAHANGATLQLLKLHQEGTIFTGDSPELLLGTVKTALDGIFEFNFEYPGSGVPYVLRLKREDNTYATLFNGYLQGTDSLNYNLGSIWKEGIAKDIKLRIDKTSGNYDVNDLLILSPLHAAHPIQDTVRITKKTNAITTQQKILFYTKQYYQNIPSVVGYYKITHVSGSRKEIYYNWIYSQGYCDSKTDEIRIKLAK